MTYPRIFKTRAFERWMRKTELLDGDLSQAVHEMSLGLVDARLGGGVVKKRIGAGSRGKRGAVRALVATHFKSQWFFVYGFGKQERANVTQDELKALQALARELLSLDAPALAHAVQCGTLIEVHHAH